MKLAFFTVAILALMQVLLAFAVSACRRKYRVSAGCPDDASHPMFRIRTAYSNCTEWHPVLMALLLIVPMAGSPKWAIWINAVVVTARCLAVVGLVTFPIKKPNIFRFLGAALTYACVSLLAMLVIYSHLSALGA